MQEEDEEDERGEKKTEKRWKSIKGIVWYVCAVNVILYIPACVCTWLTTAANQRRDFGCQATLRGYWVSHSTEEWGNITVSSFKSQRHVGRDILITGFLRENDRLSNWIHPFSTAREVKWSKCTTMADFYSFTRSLWRGLNDFTRFTKTFHLVCVSDCGVGGVRGLFAYISWLRAGAACLPRGEQMKCGFVAPCDESAHFEEEFLESFEGNRCIFLSCWWHTHCHAEKDAYSCVLDHLYCRSDPAPYCFRPLHQLSGCNQQSGIEGDACLACFDLKKLKMAHCGLTQVI